MQKKEILAKPFLKWAGGKGQILSQIIHFLPQEIEEKKINKYVEPFVGSGACFIYLAQVYQFEEIIICDINEELILAYLTIQKAVETLIEYLSEMQVKYLALSLEKRQKFFFDVRDSYNLQKKHTNFLVFSEEWIERTAQLIFLNKTCFNGLFRVNSKGHFNVPVGKYKNPLICHGENLKAISQLLQNTKIYQGNYSQCEKWVDSQTFVYFDPPYRPISKTSNFNSYSQDNFSDTEQLKLRDFYHLLNRQKAKLMLSNSDPKNKNPDDHFFENAYQGYRIERVKANRMINSNAQKRGQINELLIMNY
ncbi:modification methylase [Aphanothece hegewaldii CCALA 016]|uniref:Site-specific DNA-methyltransferase (adenine-specific) n=1 Tax=Aphanothece hegewaldii CCALA 016 TaxID=2107694 RepID=A0A2T1LVW5_9CHRO|nr:DNA adenine methylase [Aphanothece hegewaldii]PSF35994.1 modification methylase [Aphanothece hegewaldii CCALA 016]